MRRTLDTQKSCVRTRSRHGQSHDSQAGPEQTRARYDEPHRERSPDLNKASPRQLCSCPSSGNACMRLSNQCPFLFLQRQRRPPAPTSSQSRRHNFLVPLVASRAHAYFTVNCPVHETNPAKGGSCQVNTIIVQILLNFLLTSVVRFVYWMYVRCNDTIISPFGGLKWQEQQLSRHESILK